jgi:hypothetical protein
MNAMAAARARSAERDAQLRAELKPYAAGERPRPLQVAVAAAAVLAVAVIVGLASDHRLSRQGGSWYGGGFIAVFLVALSVAMWQKRYWAVLAFEALLAFQVVVTSLALIVSSAIWSTTVCVVSIGLSGWLFWKLVRVMARLQVPVSAGNG